MTLRAIFAAVALALAAQMAAAAPTVFLVRHAEKADGAGVDPKNPDLSSAGRARAESLARMLRDAGVVAIFASEYARTQQTAEEMRRASGAAVTVVPAKDLGALVEKLKATEGNVLVVGHSNTLPEIIEALGVEKAVTIADSEYDNLFVWKSSSPTELVRLRY